MNTLRLAIQKSGRLSDGSRKLIAESGIEVEQIGARLRSAAYNFPLELLYLRDDDIPEYVADGVVDAAIVGLNVVREQGGGVRIIRELGFGRCRLSIAVPKAFAVVRYNAGNIGSVTNALERIGVSYTVTGDRAELREAERIIFPGVGEASSAMAYLRSTGLDQVLRSAQVPVLGICLGLRLLCAESEEGNTPCLGLLSGRVRRFTVPRKVPHTGWSQVTVLDHPIFAGIPEGSYFHFVHSYRLEECADTVARCTYGEPFSAAAATRNFVGVQFHPEKSARLGERLLANFSEWTV